MRPEELEQIGDQEKQETDKNMEEMWGVLKERGGRWVCPDGQIKFVLDMCVRLLREWVGVPCGQL